MVDFVFKFTVFKIVVPCFNAEKYIINCIKSIQTQTEKDFNVVVVNDASTDDTLNTTLSAISDDSRFRLITTKTNGGAMSSIVSGINHLAPNDHDVISIIDGDDMLNIPKALEIVKKTYERTNCLMTYGNFVTQDGKIINPQVGKRHQQRIIDQNLFRKAPWISTHLKTFKYILYSKIDQKDFLDSSGQFWNTCSDLALMFPMLEMAGDRQEAISDPIYRYSFNIPTNDGVLRRNKQIEDDKALRNMQPYKRNSF